MSYQPPFSFSDAPQQQPEKKEWLIDLFGHFIFRSREQAISIVRALLKSEDARKSFGTIKSRPFKKLAESQDPALVKAAEEITHHAIDSFGKLLLGVIGSSGSAYQVKPGYDIRFKLEIELINPDTGAVILSENLNRGSKKAFMSYWGRWLLNHQKELSKKENH